MLDDYLCSAVLSGFVVLSSVHDYPQGFAARYGSYANLGSL